MNSARFFFARLVCKTNRLAILLCLLHVVSSAEQSKNTAPTESVSVHFTDIAEKAGLTMRNVFGGVDTKKYIVETTGTGAAVFDYDNDGWPDIFVVNGTTLEPLAGKKQPTNHLYHNNHDGTFTDVTENAGLAKNS